MFTARLRRRRHSIDTYIRGEVEERTLATANAPLPPRPEAPEASSAGADENEIASASRSDRLSA